MQRIQTAHVFDCDTAAYWEMFWDPRYDAILASKAHYSREILSDRTEGEARVWSARITPDRELPAVVQRLLGTDKLVYVQHNRLEDGVLHWSVEPAVMSDKITCSGKLGVEPVGDGRCRRWVEGGIEVKVFGVGGRIEKVIVDNVMASYETAAGAIAEYLSTR